VAEAEALEQTAHGRLVHRDGELLKGPGYKIAAPPAHNAIDSGDRTGLDAPGQSKLLIRLQLRCLSRRLAVDQTIGSIRIETEHPVANDLKPNTADPGGLAP
jgi:hypothetical protein